MARLLNPKTRVRLEELLTIPEVARRAGVHPTVVQYYIRRDDLPVHRIGQSWVMREVDVAAFLDWHRRDAATGVPRAKPGRPGRDRPLVA